MIFVNNGLIAHSNALTWYWRSKIQNFDSFSNMDLYGETLDFSRPLDYFDLSSDCADNLKRIGKPHDIFNNPLPVSLPSFSISIFCGFNDNDGIGEILRQFTSQECERNCYAVYASYYFIKPSIYCALTICYVDKDTASELDTAVLEIGQDEGPYITPLLLNENAVEQFAFDDIRAVGEYLANIWFGIQYELYYRPEEIRVVNERDQIESDNDSCGNSSIVLVKRIIRVDEDGNIIKYGTQKSGRAYRVPAWGVRGHPRKLKNGKITYVTPHMKGKERNNPEFYHAKKYQLDDEKVENDGNTSNK